MMSIQAAIALADVISSLDARRVLVSLLYSLFATSIDHTHAGKDCF